MQRINLIIQIVILFSIQSIAQPQFTDIAQLEDKKAIKSHVESIFQAVIDKDVEKMRSTHSKDWIGYKNKSTSLIQGIAEYMSDVPENLEKYHMLSYKFDEFEIKFSGNIAFVFYIASSQYKIPERPQASVTVKYRSLDLYRKERAGWIQFGSHIVMVK